jgi:hypothetical protein
VNPGNHRPDLSKYETGPWRFLLNEGAGIAHYQRIEPCFPQSVGRLNIVSQSSTIAFLHQIRAKSDPLNIEAF